jgi:hypothetical protein
MAGNDTIKIDLQSPDDLFADPEVDPWQPNSRNRSGIDEIFAKLRPYPTREPVAILVQLPPDMMTSDIERQTHDAVRRYCDGQIEVLSDELAATHSEGRRDFIVSIFVVLGLFAIIALLVSLLKLEGPLLTALVAWTGIATWAILWYPVDTFVWGRVPLRRTIRQWQKLKNSEILVRSRE